MQEPKKFKEEDCMRKQALLIAVVLLSAAFLGISQNIPKVVADIPFSFMAGGKTLPAIKSEKAITPSKADSRFFIAFSFFEANKR